MTLFCCPLFLLFFYCVLLAGHPCTFSRTPTLGRMSYHLFSFHRCRRLPCTTSAVIVLLALFSVFAFFVPIPNTFCSASLAHAATSPPKPAPSQTDVVQALPLRPVDPTVAAEKPIQPELEWQMHSSEQSALVDMLHATRRNAFLPWPDFWSGLLMKGLPRANGTFWLRFELAPASSPDSAAGTPGKRTSSVQESTPLPGLILDLNTRVFGQTAGQVQVWSVPAGAARGERILPIAPGLYPLPGSRSQSTTIYIRSQGLPGPGFAPLVRNQDGLNEVDVSGPRVMIGLLAFAFLLCLVRGVAERREWRLWAALYALCIGMEGFWTLPSTARGVIDIWDIPGLLAPGVALLILPHVGRHLMRTREHAPYLDMQLILLALPGLLISLLPLMPGQVWAIRYLPLWPILIPLFLPTVAAACVMKLPAARRFLLICTLPLLGLPAFLPAGDSLWHTGENSGLAGWLSLAPLAGLTLSALTCALIRVPRPVPATRNTRTGQSDTTSRRHVKTSFRTEKMHTGQHREEPPRPARRTAGARLELQPPQKPQGRIRHHSPLHLDLPSTGENRSLWPTTRDNDVIPGHIRAKGEELLSPEDVEQILRVPLDSILREICAIDQAPLPAEARRHAERLGLAGRRLAECVNGFGELSLPQDTFSRRGRDSGEAETHRELFDLHELMLETHNTIAEEAEARNLALSWFAAPYLPRCYEGDRQRLADVLRMLAASAVQATRRGLVQIRVQRVPESTDPGHLLFTVSDSGRGAPPMRRSSLGLIRAWELVGACDGSLSMESGPAGTSVSFTIRLAAQLPHTAQPFLPGPARSLDRPAPSASEHASGASTCRPNPVYPDNTRAGAGNSTAGSSSLSSEDRDLLSKLPASSLRIIIASETAGNRRLLAYYLDELPHEVLEARNAEEAVALYVQSPGALLLFDSGIPENDIIQAVSVIRHFEEEHTFPLASVLALVRDENQGERLRRAGCTHILNVPVSRKDLRLLALRLAPVPRRFRAAFMAEVATGMESRPGPRPDSAGKSEQPSRSRRGILPSLFSSKSGSETSVTSGRREIAGESRPARPVFSSVGEPMPMVREAETAEKSRETGKTGDPPALPELSPSPSLTPPEEPNRKETDRPDTTGEKKKEVLPLPAQARNGAIQGSVPSDPLQDTPSVVPTVHTANGQSEAAPVSAQSSPSVSPASLSLPPVSPRSAAGSASVSDPVPASGSAPDEATEWVGESTPVSGTEHAPLRLDPPRFRSALSPEETEEYPKRKRSLFQLLFGRRTPKQEQPPLSLSLPSSERSPEDAVEWVGEPTPIIRPRPKDNLFADIHTTPPEEGIPGAPASPLPETSVQEAVPDLSPDLPAQASASGNLDIPFGTENETGVPELTETLRTARYRLAASRSAVNRQRMEQTRDGAKQVVVAAKDLALYNLADLAACLEEATQSGSEEDVESLLPELLTAIDKAIAELGEADN